MGVIAFSAAGSDRESDNSPLPVQQRATRSALLRGGLGFPEHRQLLTVTSNEFLPFELVWLNRRGFLPPHTNAPSRDGKRLRSLPGRRKLQHCYALFASGKAQKRQVRVGPSPEHFDAIGIPDRLGVASQRCERDSDPLEVA